MQNINSNNFILQFKNTILNIGVTPSEALQVLLQLDEFCSQRKNHCCHFLQVWSFKAKIGPPNVLKGGHLVAGRLA